MDQHKPTIRMSGLKGDKTYKESKQIPSFKRDSNQLAEENFSKNFILLKTLSGYFFLKSGKKYI